LASNIRLYRVFIASPGGLGDERQAFKETLNEYNESEAIDRCALFLPVAWELTLPGIGRPQALINQDVEKCDYFVLLLWDRWGSPTDAENTPRYSSGVEEEFQLAWSCFHDHSKPMRQLVAFFKSVDERQLSDPGSQLQKVLDFRNKLETEKTLLFDTFDDVNSLRQKLRRSLAAWLRDHENGTLDKVTKPQPPPPQPIQPSGPATGEKPPTEADSSDIQTETEKELAQETARGNPEATYKYALKLVAIGRSSQAKTIFERVLKSTLTPELRSDVLAQLAAINALDMDFASAEQLCIESLKVLDSVPNSEKRRASRLANLGRLYLDLARFDQAMKYLEAARTLREAEEPRNWAGIAYTLHSISMVYSRQTRYRDAEQPAERALEIRRSHLGQYKGVIADSLWQLGLVRSALGRYAEAEALLNEAIGISKDEQFQWQRSFPLISLGVLRIRQSRYPEARKILEDALLIREKLRPEQVGVATVLRELADCMRLMGEFKESERYFQRSLSIYEKYFDREHPSVALTLLGLAKLYAEQGGQTQAELLFIRALGITKAKIGQGVPLYARCELGLARISAHAGKLAAAEELAKDAIHTFQRQLGVSHPETLDAQAFLESLKKG
jgi:tetratricopeptide (TPR) repeat protein